MDVPFHLAVCMCSYDTAHESLAAQVTEKLLALRSAFPPTGPVRLSLVVANDSSDADFAAAVCEAGGPETRVVPVASRRRGSSKGRALRAALLSALAREPDALAYLNLNNKVDARYTAAALRPVLQGRADVVCGSRSWRDGGAARGHGVLGAGKSRMWSAITRAALPQLAAFPDPNAPLKLMTPAAARLIVDQSRVDGLGFDAEWLCIWVGAGLRVETVPVVWVQRAGSRPPWELVPEMLLSLLMTRRRFRKM